MYQLFKLFKWTPRKYFDMCDGEKIVTKAFLEKYLEEKEEEAKQIEKMEKEMSDIG